MTAQSAASRGFMRCEICGRLSRLDGGRNCARCGHALHARKPQSLQRTSALLAAAGMLYFPANLLPIVHVRTATSDDANTIMGGVVALWSSGSWPLALLVSFASIFVPAFKLLILTWLVMSIRFGWQSHPHERTTLYRAVEFIGRWSMLDVFVVALLVALVQLQGLATITAGSAAIAFAAVVILTMYAARSFDPRVLWDALESNARRAQGT